MICLKCSGEWESRVIDGYKVHACSECGYVDTRKTTISGIDHTAPEYLAGRYYKATPIKQLPPIASFFNDLGL